MLYVANFELRPPEGKKKILASALELFERQGYFATSVDQITQNAGVSKGLVYNYFAGKEALLVGLLDDATEKMREHAITLDTGASIEQTVASFVHRYFVYLKSERRFLKWQLGMMLTPELDDIAKNSVADRAELLLRVVSRWITKMELAQPKQKARLFIALLDGVALHYLSVYKKYPLASIKKPTQNLLIMLLESK